MAAESRIAVIFDMDGVIFDSERAYIDAYRQVLTRDGIPFCEQACYDCIGVNLDRAREICLSYYGEDFDYDSYRAEVRAMVRGHGFPIKPYVNEMLSFLKCRSVPIALASSTSKESVMRMLDGADLSRCFDVIMCGDMVSRSKPDPEIFLKTAELLKADAAVCYVIEDSYNGIRCAHNAGMHPIMVPDILQPDEEILALAETVLPDLKEAKEYLEGLI